MSVVPGNVETDRQPPMAIPLRHFLVALGFLILGCALGVAVATDAVSGMAALAHVHLLLVGFVCVTIMGAMTQFVPVWSGVSLHSRRLASAQLWLVAVGTLGFAAGAATGQTGIVPAFGALLFAGVWLFAYNLGRTLATLDALGVTEFHFALALGFFALVTTLGLLLAADFHAPVFARLPVTRTAAVGAHATLAVFGAVLTTVFGALYQLATMFTQTELHGADRYLSRFERVGYPVGVTALAGGRLVSSAPLARVGGVLVAVSALAMAAVVARRLVETRVERTPMLSRYAVFALAAALWAALALPAWLRDPLGPAARFGAPGAVHLLALGVVGFVVVGTLYHVVPFIVWVHRYSDRLGFEDVPMIDDLYDGRLAAADFALLLVGSAAIVAGDWTGAGAAVVAGGILASVGAVVFGANILLVVVRHSPLPLRSVLLGSLATAGDAERAP